MPIRVYEIAQELGLDSHTVIAKAKELGIAHARVPSSSLDKITGEYLKEQMKQFPPPTSAMSRPAPIPPAPIAESGSSAPEPTTVIGQATISVRNAPWIYEMIERIRDEQIVIEILGPPGAPPLRVRLSDESSLAAAFRIHRPEPQPYLEIDDETTHLFRRAYNVAWTNPKDEWVNLAEFGNALKKLRPAFDAHAYGERSLGSLLRRMTDTFEIRADESNPIVYYVRIRHSATTTGPTELPKVPESPLPTVFPKSATGKVHNLKLGFGFIAPDDGSGNLFFHATEVVGCTIFDIRPGDRVEYEPGVNEKGLCARKVRRLA